MPAPKCHFDVEVTAAPGSGLLAGASGGEEEIETRENREIVRSILGGNGGGGFKFFEWKDLERRQSETP